MIRPHRKDPQWYAFALHRVSGLLLVLFLPVHFYLLSLAITDPETVNSALKFTAHPLVKIAEWGLVFLLSAHLFGGIRLLLLEWKSTSPEGWAPRQRKWIMICVSLAIIVSLVFLLSAL